MTHAKPVTAAGTQSAQASANIGTTSKAAPPARAPAKESPVKTPDAQNARKAELRRQIAYAYWRHSLANYPRLKELYKKYDGLEEAWLQQLREKYGTTV